MITFTGAEQLQRFTRAIKKSTTTRLYDDITRGLFDGLTKDEFESTLHLIEAQKAREIIKGNGWQVVVDTVKSRFGY